MSEPDEDPPVTGGRDLPESLVWRPSEPLKMDVFRLFAELAAQAEEIRRLREALEPFARIVPYLGVLPDRESISDLHDFTAGQCRRAAKAMEQQTTKPKD